jgi:hypothetical protein
LLRRVFLCVSIDCECDKGARWRVRRPLAFEGVHEGIAKRLHPLFREYGMKPTYLISPEVLLDAPSVEKLRSLAGCELGTHLHGEFAEPGATEPDVTSEVQRDYPPEIERAKLTWLTQTFRLAFGRDPRSFRAGRFGIGPSSIPILEDLGYAVDSSVTPHVDWSDVVEGLSFVRAPRQPYHPDRRDPSRTGDGKLLEVPVTIRPPRLGFLPVLGKRLQRRWMRPTFSSGARLIAIAQETRSEARRARETAPVILNAMFHNVEVIPGASPYASSERQAQRILSRLGALLDFARREGIVGIGLGDVPSVIGA